MAQPLPIVFIHTGNSDYLYPVFYQLKIHNAANPAYLLGDGASKQYKPLVNHRYVKDYMGYANKLAKVFFNLSTNGAAFELFCIQRWFILLEFMQKHNIERCVYLDSDILVYDNLAAYTGNFGTAGMTMCKTSAHTNFVTGIETLQHFCNWILDLYSTPEGKETLHKWHAEFKSWGRMNGGISDMTFFQRYLGLYPERLMDISEPFGDYAFDVSMECTGPCNYEGAKYPEGKKEIKLLNWQNGQPYVKQNSTGKLIRFVTLHYQGFAKFGLWWAVQNQDAAYHKKLVYYKRVLLVQRVINKIKRTLKLA